MLNDEETQLTLGFFMPQKNILKKVTVFCLRIQKSIIFVSVNNNEKLNVMKTVSNTLSAKEIKNLNISENDVMGFDYQWENNIDNYYLTINGQRIISFINSNDRKKSFNKIKKMGLGFGWKASILTDEEEGIIQASKNGENPFAYSIICANPKMNEIVK